MEGFFFARWRRTTEKYHGELIGEGKLSKITSVGTSGLKDEAELITKAARLLALVLMSRGRWNVRSRAEEENHARDSMSTAAIDDCMHGMGLHKCVRKADFGTIDSAIAGCFDDGKVVGIFGINDDSVNSLLVAFSVWDC